MAIIPGETGKNIVVNTPERRKANNLLVVFIVIVILISAVLYFGFFSSPTPAQPGAVNMMASTQQQISQSIKNLEALKSISLNNPIFTDKKFESLILSDRLPVTVGDKGRDNPFAPF